MRSSRHKAWSIAIAIALLAATSIAALASLGGGKPMTPGGGNGVGSSPPPRDASVKPSPPGP